MKLLNILSIFALCLALVACGDDNSSSDDNEELADACTELNDNRFNCQSMLEGIQDNVVVPTVTQLATDLSGLTTSLDAYCAAIDGATEAASLDAAQASWRSATDTLQQLEVMQIGPVTAVREEIYSWPLVDSCKIDEQIILSSSDTDISSVTPQRRGLFAVEYALFNSNLNHSCPATNNALNPTTGTPWNSQAEVIRKTARCEFAQKALIDVAARVDGLSTELQTYQIETAFNDLQQAANAVSDAIFYLEKQTKDAKLIALLPQTSSEDFNPDMVESVYANYSKEMMLANIEGVEAIFTGNGEIGLDDYLVAAGQADLADEMIAALANVKTAVMAIDGSFSDIVNAATADDIVPCINAGNTTTDLEKLCELPTTLKTFTDELKGSFILALQFTAPANAEGDND